MNPQLTLCNFRSFGTKGANFEIAPITILTGCNSAGKSSAVKAELLLSGVVKQIEQRFNKFVNSGDKLYKISLRQILSDLVLHMSDKTLQLGRFDRTVNDQSENDILSFSYTVYSELLLSNLTVELSFCGKSDDVVNDAVLTHLCVKNGDAVLVNIDGLDKEFHESVFSPVNEHINYTCIVDSFDKFLVYCMGNQSLYDAWEDDLTGHKSLSADEIKKRLGVVKQLLQTYSVGNQDIDGYRNLPGIITIAPSFEAANNYLKKKTLYSWLPIFDTSNNLTKQEFREWMLAYAKKSCSENNRQPEDFANYFCDDFEASQNTTIAEYFSGLEYKSLEEADMDNVGVHSPIKFSKGLRLIDFDKNIWEEEEIPARLSREEYDSHSFSTMIDALEFIFFNEHPVDPVTHDYSDIPNRFEVLRCLKAFARCVVVDVLMPDFLSNIQYVNSSSTIVRRLYVLDDNDKIGNSISQYNNGNKQQFFGNGIHADTLSQSEKWKYIPGTFLNKWCQKFELGDKISIEGNEQGLGAMVYVERNGHKRLMADEGYGITQLFTLLLQIECRILNAPRKQVLSGKWRVPHESAYNVTYSPQYICVEEPEIHLHPKFQSILADMFVEAFQKYNIRFIIETHSEYLIRKLQVLIADKECSLTSGDVSLNYVEKDEKGVSDNRQIKILEDGRLSEPFGAGFYDEADGLAMELMKYKARRQ